MTLIQSISGIRGTMGGKPGTGLTPYDIVRFSGAYGSWLKNQYPGDQWQVVIGRDARISGPMVSKIVSSTLQALGIDVIDAGMSTTPTVAMGVVYHQASGGIVITASHNPKNWNALKLMDNKGEFLSDEQAHEMNAFIQPEQIEYVSADKLGSYSLDDVMPDMHIEKILELPLVDKDAIRAAGYTVVVDGVNSVGGIAMPRLLKALGVKEVIEVFCEPNGLFQHNPEPLPENLTKLSDEVTNKKAHLGFAVDPDVDRLAIVCEDGDMFGEEYTLVAVADYVLTSTPGNTVSNLSSTMALKELTEKFGQQHFASAVGEANVVRLMKEKQAVIGGEGNGGVIYPALHYGRDALVGAALFLSHLAKSGKSCSALKSRYPDYYMSKNKIELSDEVDTARLLEQISEKYSRYKVDKTDGVKIWFEAEWVHLRRSNTESVIRVYAESDSPVKADHLASKIQADIRELLKGEEE